MIQLITDTDVLPLRSLVLREGRLAPEECRFPTDTLPGSFHLGGYKGDELACIASFHLQTCGNYQGVGYQLRGMATLPRYQGQGLGSELATYAINYLHKQNAGYVWCNARKKALLFYERLGFSIVSGEFEVPGIGPHYAMYLDLKQKP